MNYVYILIAAIEVVIGLPWGWHDTAICEETSRILPLTVLLLDPSSDDVCDVQVVQFQMSKMSVTVDTNIGKLNPVSFDTRLVQVVDHAMIVCGMDAGLASSAEVWHLCDIGKLTCGFGLHVASTEG